MPRIYMDANATTPVLPEVLAAMAPFWSDRFGNASSVHQGGQRARAAVENARKSVSNLLSGHPSEIVFTSGGTEGDNLALAGVLEASTPGPAHLITSSIEHHAVLHAAEALQKRRGAEITLTVLPCDPDGLIQPQTLTAALQPNTRLVSIMLANNETGALQPITELARITHAGGALFHTDAVAAAGKLPIDVNALGCDLLTLSGHKMHAPQGVGALFVRRGTPLAPMLHGGTHERQRRAGTENLPGIVGFGHAAELARIWLTTDGPARLCHLRNQLENQLLSTIPECGINGPRPHRAPNTTNLHFEHVDSESLVISLDLAGLAASGGSACQSGATEPSHVLTAMGLPHARARSSIRLSLTRHTTEAEVAEAVRLITSAVARLRSLSPAWRAAHPTPPSA